MTEFTMRSSLLRFCHHHHHHLPAMINNFQLDKALRALCFSGHLLQAVDLLCRTWSSLNSHTYSFILQETINRCQGNLGTRIHAHIIISGFALNDYLTTKLVISYAKSGNLDAAHHLFDRMPHRGLIPWNAMISGYVQKGLYQEALELYYSMRVSGLVPDQFTFASVFRACGRMAVLEHGKRAHCVLVKTQMEANVVVNSALVDMYFKCSSPDDGRWVFECSPERNVFTWTALISGYGQHGRVLDVLKMFERMIDEGFRPNQVTFLAVLSACSRGGLVDAGWKYSSSMTRGYGIKPKGEHYAAIVDMLGRAGRLNEAYEFVKSTPCEGHATIWGALLGACRIHGDIELAKLAAEKFFDMDPANTGKYIVLSNTYAALEMWEISAGIRGRIGTSGMKKEPAWSSIEVRGEVYTFLIGDKSHEQSDSICQMAITLGCAIAEAAYVYYASNN